MAAFFFVSIFLPGLWHVPAVPSNPFPADVTVLTDPTGQDLPGVTSAPAEEETIKAPKSVPMTMTSLASSSLDLCLALGKSSAVPPTLQVQPMVMLPHTCSIHPASGQRHRVALIPNHVFPAAPAQPELEARLALSSTPHSPGHSLSLILFPIEGSNLPLPLPPPLMHYFLPSVDCLDAGKYLKYFLHWPLSFRSDFSLSPLQFHCQHGLSEMQKVL